MHEITRRKFIIGSGALAAAAVLPTTTDAANSIKVNRGNNSMVKKTVLITGAGSGFGQSVSLALAARGHHVIAGVQLTPQVTQLLELARQHGVSLQVEKLDILEPRDREYAWQWDIDVLFNNAGIAEAGAVAEMPIDVLRSQFETNVFSSMALTQGFIKRMVARRSGKIVFVSSVAGLLTGAFTGAYCASKHALEAIAEALHMELAEFGVKVATVNPGPYLTGFNDRMMESFRKWYDPKVNFIDHSKLKFPFDQFDPQEMVDKMVSVIEEDNGLFRNLLPESFIQVVKDDQSNGWTRKQ
ncbi:SDR family oxidoreductase [Serratia ureilytica]|uniref:SDR family oxidoreductase n=1 Tax=Serratia ureilytica TaxID=300181 RepID=UPI001D17E8AC|nr:SDR family oxidoreductase [Serratia ureilytica]MCC4106156.1 SDR family oxidoreductase [Serratia ureilytica]